jgi:predicted metal-dependent hydrolase
MATKTVSIPDIGEVTLYKKRGNRSLRLSISHSGQVRVSLPYWLPYAAAEQFARSKAEWINANRHKTEAIALEHGHAIGKAHRLYFEAGPESLKLSTRIEGNAIRICFPRSQDVADEAVQQAANRASVRALRKEAQALLPPRLRALAGQYGFSYKSVGVKPLKSRWGSCTSAQDITLNIFLMQLPWHLIDYVLVHELTHTRIMQHGAPFWAEMERHLPSAKSLRKQIAAYQPVLRAMSERSM